MLYWGEGVVKTATPEVQSGVGNDKVCVSVFIKRNLDGEEKMYWCFFKNLFALNEWVV